MIDNFSLNVTCKLRSEISHKYSLMIRLSESNEIIEGESWSNADSIKKDQRAV